MFICCCRFFPVYFFLLMELNFDFFPLFPSSEGFFKIRTFFGLKNWTLNSQLKICLYLTNLMKCLFASSQ